MEHEITNVELDVDEDRACVSCVYDGSRYHVWLNANLKPMDEVLYKNPGSGQPDFNTRHLDQFGALGRKIVPAMLAKIPELLPAAKAKAEYEEAERQAHNEDNWRDGLVRDAAPNLLDALKVAENFIFIYARPGSPIRNNVLTQIGKAIAKALPPKEK